MTRLQKKEKKMVRDFINKMFEIIGSDMTYDKILEENEKYCEEKGESMADCCYPWFDSYTWTIEQEEECRKWFVPTYAQRFRVNKAKGSNSAENMWGLFVLEWGFARSNYLIGGQDV